MNFDLLIEQVEHTHVFLQKSALTAVNINLSLRNWLIGFYIVGFEQKGSDRAVYGERLLEKMSFNLKHIKGMSPRNLLSFRLFYNTYPHVSVLFTQKNEIQSQQLKYLIHGVRNFIESDNQPHLINLRNQISQSPTAKLQITDNQTYTPIELLITSLSFTHLVEIIKLTEPLKRTFYEIEAIKGAWSVKELQRQINTLLYERTGLSKNKAELIKLANKNAETQKIENAIRNPYFFEFLGLKDTDVMTENDLENALLAHLQEFILELGDGFCFEARQKRINLGEKYFHIDLVFYHRILKCHVLIELKMNEVDYAAITQLNTYVSYYRKNIMQADDKPTIGILLCTNKDEAFVEYALAGLDEKLFVSQYLIHIPSKERLEQFIKSEIRNR